MKLQRDNAILKENQIKLEASVESQEESHRQTMLKTL